MEQRVLIHAPRGRDAQVVQKVLDSGRQRSLVCSGERELVACMSEGAAAAILTEESLSSILGDGLEGWLAAQPPWSDFPFIVLASKQAGRRSGAAFAALEKLGNVILLERPVNAETLLSAAHAAVRARRRQYATRVHLEQIGESRSTVERLNSELEMRIEARTRELAMANDRLMKEIAERERVQGALVQAQKLEAIGRLTGGIAHDFNNLLHVVTMNLELIERMTGDEKLKPIADQARRAAARGAKLTSQLLAFARNQSLLPKLADVNELLLGMKELLAVSVGSSVAVNMALAPGPVRAVVDANQLEMAVLNLALNARDAMPAGGTITIGTEVRGIAEAGLAPGRYAVVSVSDTGVGIPSNLLEKVFEPFFTTKAVGSGTGLGLSQVYGFAQQSGGLAKVGSEPGQGTRVEILVPAASQEIEVAAPAEPAHLPSTDKPMRILVVEDDPDVRRVISECLAVIGYTVSEAADGASGLAALVADRPDLLMVDYVMPDMNGAEVIRRARELVGELPVILATGYADMGAVGRVLGTQSILLKPFDIGALADAVEQALRNRPEPSGMAANDASAPASSAA